MIRQLLLNHNHWEKPAIIDDNGTLSYHDLAQKALAVGRSILKSPGANVAIFLPNNADFIAALYGTILVGMTAFPLNHTLTKHEIIPLLDKATVKTVITSKSSTLFFEDIQKHYLPDLQIVYADDLVAEDSEALPEGMPAYSDGPMVLLNTSGTTGNIKIVQLSEKNVDTVVLGYMERVNISEADMGDVRYIIATPFSSVYGLLVLSACLYSGFPIVLFTEEFTLTAFYRAVQMYRVTHYEGGNVAPLLMAQTAGRPIPYDITTLKYLAFGGSKMPVLVLDTLLHAYPEVGFWQGYGMTEAGPLISKHRRTAPDDLKKMNKQDSVGTAIKSVKIAIDTEHGITDTPYIEGEIIVKGPNVMLGYYHNQTETDKAIINGYLHTGDIGYLDEDKYLYICGRKKSLIIVRGLNVYPEEVEGCLLNSGLVEECIVYSEMDRFENEVVCADIVPVSPDVIVENVIDYCRLHLSNYKQPKRIRIVNGIPKALSGKPKRSSGES